MKDKTIFKEKLYHHTMPVRDGLWEAIEAQLPPKKEQRIFPIFWFTLFATTLLGGVLMIGLFNQKQTTLSTEVSKQQVTITPDQESNKSVSEITTSNSTNTEIEETENSNVLATNKHNHSANQSAGQNFKNQSARRPSSSIKFDQALKPIPSESITASQSSAGVAHAASSFHSTSEFNIVSFLPLIDVDFSAEKTATLGITSMKPDPNCYKFTGPDGKYAFSVDVLGGPGFSPKSYEQNSDEFSIYADARKATESNQYAWSVGARLNLHHRSGLTGRLGFQYTQAGDLFDYTDSLATQSTTRIDSFFAADGTFLYEETSQVLILGTLIKKIHNTYKYLDIPLIIGYEMPLGGSALMFNVGPVFNITSCYEGQILDPMLHPRSITPGDPGAIDVYKTSLGMSIYIGAGVLFPLTENLSGLIEPSFLYRLNPVTISSYPLKERRHYAGLNLGIRYHIH